MKRKFSKQIETTCIVNQYFSKSSVEEITENDIREHFYSNKINHYIVKLISDNLILEKSPEMYDVDFENRDSIIEAYNSFIESYELKPNKPSQPVGTIIAYGKGRMRKNEYLGVLVVIAYPKSIQIELNAGELSTIDNIVRIIENYGFYNFKEDYIHGIQNSYSEISLGKKVYGESWEKPSKAIFNEKDYKQLVKLHKKVGLRLCEWVTGD